MDRGRGRGGPDARPRSFGAPPGGADLARDPDAAIPTGESAKPTALRRLAVNKDKDKGKGKGSGVEEERAPKKAVKGKEERRGGGGLLSSDEKVAMARNPRKKGAKGNAGVAAPVQTGPAKVTLGEAITVGDLARARNGGAASVVKDLMKMGVLASITQFIDADTAQKIAEGYGAEVTRGEALEDAEGADVSALGILEDEDEDKTLQRRPPVVTIMGHVDHGKTSLLDAYRARAFSASSVAAGEAGGITQNIGAYTVPFPEGVGPEDEAGRAVTFLDTPGHAAFSEMRSRGANVTDIVILVVASDEGVMEQTISSIRAAKAANVPVIVAFTKSDKPEADMPKVKLQLLEHEVVLEEFGGDVLHAPVSAKTGDGLDTLMEMIALQADVLDIKANPDRLAAGAVIEARQVTGQGPVATVLVQKGTLRVGDIVVAGAQWGRVRSLVNEFGERLEEAPPSAVVELVGLSGLPEAGDQLTATPEEGAARELAETRQRLLRDRRSSALFAMRSSADRAAFLSGRVEGELPTKVLDFVVKCDVQGSAEALSRAVAELSAADDKLQVKTRVLRSGAGAITNEDIMLASVSSATILGFNSPASALQKEEAAKVGVAIKEFQIVYDCLDEVKAMMAALIRPPPSKQLGALVGTLDVLQTFKIGAVGKVAGCKVVSGFVRVGCNIRILRGNIIEYEGKLQSLRSFKDLVERVDVGSECGISFEDYQGMEPDDRVEAYAARDAVGDDD
jgi:translation initiation factor IF-2